MAEIILGDLKATINGIPVDVQDMTYKTKEKEAYAEKFGDIISSFDIHIDAKQSNELLAHFNALLWPRGYWLRRRTHQRRRTWSHMAKQLGITRGQARTLCRSGWVDLK